MGCIKKNDTDYKFSKLQLQFFEFIKSPNVFISNDDWIIPFNKFKNDKNSLILFDPPYLSLCNDFTKIRVLMYMSICLIIILKISKVIYILY